MLPALNKGGGTVTEQQRGGLGFGGGCPDSAGSLVAHHAGAHGFLRRASFHEHWAFSGLDFSDDDEVAFAAEKDVFALLNPDTMLGVRVKISKLSLER